MLDRAIEKLALIDIETAGKLLRHGAWFIHVQ